jgi:benzoate membrane transport protein
MAFSETLRRNLPVIGAAVRMMVIAIAVLSIPLTAAQELGLSTGQTAGWIMALYGLPAILSLVLSFRFRLPLLVTGNLFVILFVSGLGGRIGYRELVGASMLAGVGVLAVALLGLGKRLAALVPIPIMFGLLAGAVLPFVARVFSAFGDSYVLIGGTLLVYVVSRRFLGERLPPIMPALLTGFALAALTGQFGRPSEPLALALPAWTLPVFSIRAILTVTPVFIVLITLQGNLPSMRFLNSQAYDPPEFVIGLASGSGTILGSFLGPTGASLSLPATSIVAGDGAGEHEIRHRSVLLSSIVALAIGLLASISAGLAEIIPSALLVTLAGLAVIDVLASALARVTRGPLLLGPLFAFAIAVSNISFLGFGSYFWSLVIGTGVSMLLEPDRLRELQAAESEQAET